MISQLQETRDSPQPDTKLCTQMSGRALRLALSETFGHVIRARPLPPRPLPRSHPLSLPPPPSPAGPAHPPPRRLPEALPGRAAGGRAPTARQTDAREDGLTDTRRAAGTHGPGRCSEARPGGLGPRSGEVTATRALKGWASRASGVPAPLAPREEAPPGPGAGKWRRPAVEHGSCAGPARSRPARRARVPVAMLGSGPRPAGGGAGGRGGRPGLGRVRDAGSGALSECRAGRGLHRVALQARGTGGSRPWGRGRGSRRDTESKWNWGQGP